MTRLPLVLAAVFTLSVSATISQAGDWLPVLDCSASSDSPDSIAMSFKIWNHAFLSVCRTDIIPLTQDGYPAVPFSASISTEGWSCEPDTIPGGFVIRGCVPQLELSPLITIRSSSRIVPVRARLYNSDGVLVRTVQDILWCPAVGTPALPSSFGRLKVLYRD